MLFATIAKRYIQKSDCLRKRSAKLALLFVGDADLASWLS
jgi:hypothetical protein